MAKQLESVNTKKILIICTTLGKVHRGFEISADQLFIELSKVKKNKVYIAQQIVSKNNRNNRIAIKFISRGSFLYNFICKIKSLDFANFIHEVSFAIMVLPWILINRPDLIYYTEPRLGNAFFHIRKLLKLNFKLFFANGAPYEPEVYINRCDLVQQKVNWTYNKALYAGVKPNKMKLIPNGFYLRENKILDEVEKQLLKEKLSITKNNVLLSVGAINEYHKRIDYLIEESIEYLLKNNAILICLGNISKESERIIEKYQFLIKNDYLIIKSVDPNSIHKYYQVADLFIHTSLFEGFGRSIVEALSFGCKCVLHDFEGFKEIAGNTALYIDMTKCGMLKNTIKEISNNEYHFQPPNVIRDRVVAKYDWDEISKVYIKTIEELCQE